MTATTQIDWDSVQSIIDSMRHEDESETTVSDEVSFFMEQVTLLENQGWPFQEIAIEDSSSHEYMGIPIELAHATLCIFKFCAEKNIDLGSAIQKVMTFRV
jgi:hypothetical protein